ncbi:hypothetical protein BK140_09825 [Paenibacillus macerans]|nr:hypothetical protein BK140_09825 [Paenibacillus macerans]
MRGPGHVWMAVGLASRSFISYSEECLPDPKNLSYRQKRPAYIVKGVSANIQGVKILRIGKEL